MERDFGLKPISSGQLLRDLSTPKPGVEPSESARAIAATLARGGTCALSRSLELSSTISRLRGVYIELVSDDLMLRIITEALTNEKVNASGWILDGYPRNVSQAEALQGVLERHRLPLDRVLYIDVPQEEILNRLGGRMVHLASGRVYNLSFNPPKKPGIDDVTGEPLIVREDDKPVRRHAHTQRSHTPTGLHLQDCSPERLPLCRRRYATVSKSTFSRRRLCCSTTRARAC